MRIVNETALTFDEVNEMLTQKENSDNQSDYQSSPLKVFGGPSGTRTQDRPVMSRML